MISSYDARNHVPFTRDYLIRSESLYTVCSPVADTGGWRETLVWERTTCDPVLRRPRYRNSSIEKALLGALYELEAEGRVVRTELRCDSNDDQRLLCWRLRQPDGLRV